MITNNSPASPRDLKYNWTELLRRAKVVAIDTETNTLNLFEPTARVNGFSLCVKVDNVYISEYVPVGHIRGYNLPRDIWEPILRLASSKRAIFHNANYDRKAIALLLGEQVIDRFYDTTKLCHLLNENAPKKYSLENCCQLYLGNPGKVKTPVFEALLSVFGWNGIAGTEIDEYASADAECTYKLWEVVTARLSKESGRAVLDYWNTLEMPNFDVMYGMKELGIRVDLEHCKRWEERGLQRMREIRMELGFDPGKPSELKPVLYDQLGLPVIVNPKTGKPTLNKDALDEYDLMLESMNNPIAKRIIEYRGWGKAVSSYYAPYQEHVDADGRIRASFASHGTVTGRFACSKPNLQQIPKELENKPWSEGVKPCFIPEDGYELWEFDYSQLELRMGAAFGNDKKLLGIFNDPSGRDIFTEMSAEMGWQRQDCKTFTYAIDYGAGAKRVKYIFGVSEKQAKAYIAEFYDNYPGLGRINARSKYEAETTGKLTLWSGRNRHFPNRNDGYKAFNSLIQGGSADLVKKVMNELHKAMPELRMLIQVHDSIWFELPKGKVEYYKNRIREIMENPFPEEDIVTFKVDGHMVGGQIDELVPA